MIDSTELFCWHDADCCELRYSDGSASTRTRKMSLLTLNAVNGREEEEHVNDEKAWRS